MKIQNILYANSYRINDKISVVIPTVGDILDDEDSYYGAVAMVTATPYEMMVQLDDAGIDFTSITEYELFHLMFNGLKGSDTSRLFGDLDLSKFRTSLNSNNRVVLFDKDNDIVIDEAIYRDIASALRKINFIDKVNKKPANDAAKSYMIERARVKQKRAARLGYKSQLEEHIIAMVNTEQYKYDYEGTRNLSIYQFNTCVHQVVKKVNYDHTIAGCYAGTIDIKKINQNELNWLSQK